MLEISESAIFAAIELIKDKEIDKKNKKFHQHNLNTYDYPSGKKIIKLAGEHEFIQLIGSEEDRNLYKKKLRKILMNILKKNKGPELFSLPMGIKHFLEKFDDNFIQVLNSCDLLIKLNHKEETKEIRDWWKELINFSRLLVDEKKLESGDQGEEKTLQYEVEKLKKIGIKKEPIWVSFYDNFLGYDIESWNKDLSIIFIESKKSSKLNGEFFISKGEWLAAKRETNSYFVYLWIQESLIPRIIDYKELKSYINDYDIIKEKNAFWPKLKIIPEGKN